MTAATRKQAERARRKERGEVLVSAWLSPEMLEKLDKYGKPSGMTRGEMIKSAIMGLGR